MPFDRVTGAHAPHTKTGVADVHTAGGIREFFKVNHLVWYSDRFEVQVLDQLPDTVTLATRSTFWHTTLQIPGSDKEIAKRVNKGRVEQDLGRLVVGIRGLLKESLGKSTVSPLREQDEESRFLPNLFQFKQGTEEYTIIVTRHSVRDNGFKKRVWYCDVLPWWNKQFRIGSRVFFFDS